MQGNKRAKWIRCIILLGLLSWVTIETYLHQILGGSKASSVHALCPYGALESLYAVITTGTFVQKIFSGTMVLFGVTLLIAILFRRSFCGLLCPFGFLQELFSMLRQKILKKRFEIPEKIDKPLRYLKYFVFLLTTAMAWIYGTLWMSPFDPYVAYTHITAISDAIDENAWSIMGFLLLGVTLVGSFLYDRFFCKFLCPAGAFYGILGKISPTKIQRNTELCIHCNLCSQSCPVNIRVAQLEKVGSAECISCNLCVTTCPKKGALEIKTVKKTVHPAVMLGIVVGIFFGSIWIADLTGLYQVTPKAFKEGEKVSISQVKGYYTIEETSQLTGLSLEAVYQKLSIPETVPKETMLKEVQKQVQGYSLDKIKEQLH